MFYVKYQNYISQIWSEPDNICGSYETFIAMMYRNKITKVIEWYQLFFIKMFMQKAKAREDLTKY